MADRLGPSVSVHIAEVSLIRNRERFHCTKVHSYSHYTAVPGQVSGQVNDVINVATKGQTTLFKASEVLEQTMEAYRYARFAARDDFDLKRQSGQLLRDYDETLKAMIKCRLDSQLDEASQKEDECSRKLGELLDCLDDMKLVKCATLFRTLW